MFYPLGTWTEYHGDRSLWDVHLMADRKCVGEGWRQQTFTYPPLVIYFSHLLKSPQLPQQAQADEILFSIEYLSGSLWEVFCI